MARLKRCQPSGCSSMSDNFEAGLAMNPISRVQRKAVIAFNDTTKTMTSRPALAVKIAECIAEYAEVEFTLGSALGALLKSEAKTGLAMFVRANSRTAQKMMVSLAAEEVLEPDHLTIFSIIMSKAVAPAMGDRDKLAHWCWGYSPDLPDALLLMDPVHKTKNLAAYFLMPDTPPKIDRDAIFVVTGSDLTQTLNRIGEARRLLNQFISSVWQGNSKAKRARFRQALADEPLIRAELRRMKEPAKNGQKSQPQPRRRDRRAKR